MIDDITANNLLNVGKFVHEIEKLKAVKRRIRLPKEDRYETVAEHTWQVALLAMFLVPQHHTEINHLKVIKMLLVHDLGEIDAGDQHLYSSTHNNAKEEKQCIERLSKTLPEREGSELIRLWHEFEENKTPEARFAQGIDRLLPVMQNILSEGQNSWLENGTTLEAIIIKNQKISQLGENIWSSITNQLFALRSKGIIE